MKPRAKMLTCLGVALVAATLVSSAIADPLMGQGVAPKDEVEVHVSVFLEKLLDVDETNQRFTALFQLYFSWYDDRAFKKSQKSTADFRNGVTSTCSKMCRSDVPARSDYTRTIHELSCCDEVWLPSIKAKNIVGSFNERHQDYTIYLDLNGNVGWKVQLQGTFFTPFYFAKFPFDSQELDLHFTQSSGKLTTVKKFVPSAIAHRWFQRAEGDSCPGWDVKEVKMEQFNVTLTDAVREYTTKYGRMSAETDVMPMARPDNASSEDKEDILASQRNQDFIAIIKVSRYSQSYVLTMVVPLLLLKLLLFATFFIPAADAVNIRTRMFVAIFFSITALNFTVSNKLPASSYATGIEELLLTSYAIAALATPQAIVVGVLEVNAKNQQAEIERKEAKAKQKLNLSSIMSAKRTPSTDITQERVIPIGEDNRRNGGGSQTNNNGGGGGGGVMKASAFTEVLSRALSAQYGALVGKPVEQVNFKYASKAGKIIDRSFYYTFLIVDLVCFSLFFSQGSITEINCNCSNLHVSALALVTLVGRHPAALVSVHFHPYSLSSSSIPNLTLHPPPPPEKK